MKSKIKKAIIPIFLSVLIGCISAKFTYNVYESNNDLAYSNNKIYLIQSGEYDSYDNMRANTMSYNYIYYTEDNVYKTIIGITKNKENISKISNIYDGEVIINTYYLDNDDITNKINKYDRLLEEEKDNKKIIDIVNEMLEFYKEEEIKLIKMD